jgi:hypothetical protein
VDEKERRRRKEEVSTHLSLECATLLQLTVASTLNARCSYSDGGGAARRLLSLLPLKHSHPQSVSSVLIPDHWSIRRVDEDFGRWRVIVRCHRLVEVELPPLRLRILRHSDVEEALAMLGVPVVRVSKVTCRVGGGAELVLELEAVAVEGDDAADELFVRFDGG